MNQWDEGMSRLSTVHGRGGQTYRQTELAWHRAGPNGPPQKLDEIPGLENGPGIGNPICVKLLEESGVTVASSTNNIRVLSLRSHALAWPQGQLGICPPPQLYHNWVLRLE